MDEDPMTNHKIKAKGPAIGDKQDFILIFDKATGNARVQYLMVNPETKSSVFPKKNVVTFSKIQKLVEYRATVMDNELYIVGGKDWESGQYSSSVLKYNPDSNTWSTLQRMKTARCRFSIDVINSHLYVTGGETVKNKVTSSAECYDPTLDEWKEFKSLPRPRMDHASCTVNKKLYVSGGRSSRSHQCSDVFWVYDPKTNQWTEPEPGIILPSPREKHAMVFDGNDTIYIYAGCSDDLEKGVKSEDCSVYSYTCSLPQTGLTPWWDRGHHAMLHSRSSTGTFILGQRIYVVGGKSFDRGDGVKQVEYYNMENRRWRHAFNLFEDNDGYGNVDCVKLRVPETNCAFNFSDFIVYEKWVMW